MRASELDKVLFPISDHERAYQRGFTLDYRSIYSHKTINEKEVLYIDLQKLLKKDDRLMLTCKKHSRFQEFPEHCHDNIEINYMYSGSCRQTINGKEYTLHAGEAILLNYDTVHKIEPLGEDDILIDLNIGRSYLNGNFFNRFSSESIVMQFFMKALSNQVSHEDFLIFHSSESERLSMYMKDFLCEWYDPSTISDDILNSLLTLILLELINIYKHEYTESHRKKNESVIQILHYIEGNFRTCTLKSTAQFFNMNPNYLSNLLKKETGSSYKELVMQQRLNAVKSMLQNTDLSIQEICEHLNYQNVSFLYEKFIEDVGCRPGEYRERFR